MWGLRSLQLCCKMCWPPDRLLVIWHPFDKSKINLWNESGFHVIWDHSPPIVKAVSRRFRCLTFKVNPRFCSRKYDAHDAPSFQSQGLFLYFNPRDCFVNSSLVMIPQVWIWSCPNQSMKASWINSWPNPVMMCPPRLCSQGYVEALRVSVGRRTRRTNDLSSPQASRKQRFNLQRVTLTWWWALPKSYVLHRYIMCNVHISRWINYLIYTLGIDLWRDCNNISTYNEII